MSAFGVIVCLTALMLILLNFSRASVHFDLPALLSSLVAISESKSVTSARAMGAVRTTGEAFAQSPRPLRLRTSPLICLSRASNEQDCSSLGYTCTYVACWTLINSTASGWHVLRVLRNCYRHNLTIQPSQLKPSKVA